MKKIILILLISAKLYAAKIDKVIIATTNTQTNLNYWSTVSKVWKHHIRIEPLLLLITKDENVKVDESSGKVLKFQPIDVISESTYANMLKLIIPSYFRDEICMLSDIDILPISRKFFSEEFKKYESDNFLVVCNKTNRNSHPKEASNYIIAKGKLFKDIFLNQNSSLPNSFNEIGEMVKKWVTLQKNSKNLDKSFFTTKLTNWKFFSTKCVYHCNKKGNRFDGKNWLYTRDLLIKSCALQVNPLFYQYSCYIDCQLPAPYENYKKQIDRLLQDMSIDRKALL